MKRILAIILLSVLTLSLLLCSCNKKDKDEIIKKIDIRQNGNFVTVVYEDGYERAYSLTQPIETFIENDGMRSARSMGILSHPYSTWFGSLGGDDHPIQIINPLESGTSENQGGIVIKPVEPEISENEGDIAIKPVESGTSEPQFVIGTAIPVTGYFQIEMNSDTWLYTFFEHNGKKYQDCEAEILTLMFQKTTLIDFATGYEKEPIESIVDFRWFENLEAVILPASIKKVGRNAFDGCTKLTTVYYYGTADEWKSVELVGTKKTDNEDKEKVETIPNLLESCTVYFYSEEAPTAAGNYWHLVDGKPTAW